MAYTDHFFMDRPPREIQQLLNKQVLDERVGVDSEEAGPRGSSLEGGSTTRAAGGRPRSASKRKAFNKKRVYGPESDFDSMYKA